MHRSRPIMIALMLAFISSALACSANQNLRRCDDSVNEFHRLFNAQQYEAAYRLFDKPYKAKVSLAEHESSFGMLRQRLGAVKDTKQTGWQVSTQPGGSRISLQYKTVFANGEGDEQFLFFLTDSETVLENYDLQSPLLIDR